MFNLFKKTEATDDDCPVHKEVHVSYYEGHAVRHAKPMRGEMWYKFLDRCKEQRQRLANDLKKKKKL